MKRFWRGERKHIDQEKVKLDRKRLFDLKGYMDRNDLKGYIRYIRDYDPNITDEKMEGFIQLFHAQRMRHPNDE